MLASASIRTPGGDSGGGIGSRSSTSQPARLAVTAPAPRVTAPVGVGPDADDRSDVVGAGRDPHRGRDVLVVEVELEASYAGHGEPLVQACVAEPVREVVAPRGVHQLHEARTER